MYSITTHIEILTQHHLGKVITSETQGIECYGAYILDQKTNQIDTFLSRITMMATGGIGCIYQTTTNPLVATGDGIAMVSRAKGEIKGMEFVQFHPTALYHPGDRPSFLISEAVRGYGAILRTKDSKEFMHKYDKRESLAPRDIVARAIDTEMKNRGDDYVYLDVTHKDPEETKKHFPNIYEKCKSYGIDITKDYIPVAPAAHYLCGGIRVNIHGETSIKRLYANGECACTGLRRKPIGLQFTYRSCGFRRRSGQTFCSPIKRFLFSGEYSPLECRRYHFTRRNGIDNPKLQRGERNHVVVRRHCPFQSSLTTCNGKIEYFISRNRKLVSTLGSFPRNL